MKILGIFLLWCGVVSSQQTYFWDEFSEEVDLRMSTVKLSKARLRQLPLVLQHLDLALQNIWPGARVIVFGSVVHGLATASSDVDCTVLLPQRADTSPALMDEARRALQAHPQTFTDVHPVPAPIPVITFIHAPTTFHADLTVNNFNGLQTSNLFNYLLHIDENYYKLTFIVKHFAKIHGLTSTATLPSYGLVLMVVFYLQQRNMLSPIATLQSNVKPVIINEWNISFREMEYQNNLSSSLVSLLRGFFDFYEHFDYGKYIISPYSGYPIKKRLFSNVNSVPSEFKLYRYNVDAKITKALPTENELIVQDVFAHNDNVAKNVTSNALRKFIAILKVTAFKFNKNPKSLLDTIF